MPCKGTFVNKGSPDWAKSGQYRLILPANVSRSQRELPRVTDPVPSRDKRVVALHPQLIKTHSRTTMALLPILQYPDARLHTVAKPVAQVDERIRQLVDDMLETMYDAKGVGLAATQVNVHLRLVVIDTSEDRSQPLVLINPEIIKASAEMIIWEEGCLSVPTIYDKVDRHAQVRVRALGRDGQPYEFDAEDLLGVCVQHELDHLMGKVFVEYLSPLKRNRIKTKMIKRVRDEA
jgi:peptide deformylase